MTLDDALAEATRRLKNTRAARPPIPDDPIDTWLVETLGELVPCGVDPPTIEAGYIKTAAGEAYTAEEARAVATSLLRAADDLDRSTTRVATIPFKGEF